MRWNWQQPDWPHFTYDASLLAEREAQFLLRSGILVGSVRHIADADRDLLTVELLSSEALKTSEIEGEHLDRESVQSSIRRQFGLQSDGRRVPDAERGIADMTVDLYRTFREPLSDQTLFGWHATLTTGQKDIRDIGRYRTHPEPMQVVSGYLHKPRIHFEAPPSDSVPEQMRDFIRWFNRTMPGGEAPLPALTRAGIAHLYFVSIHPFEDGNGRIARAISEKALAQTLDAPSLILLSTCIQSARKNYYDALERANKNNGISAWLDYFSGVVLQAQTTTLDRVEFIIRKTKLYDRLAPQLNARQKKALERMFREGPEGFTGGLSAENYISITGASRATATRDLQELVELGALTRTGERKHTRYRLCLSDSGND